MNNNIITGATFIGNQGSIGTLVNTGTITDANIGIVNSSAATIDLFINTGTIHAAGVAVSNGGLIGALTNGVQGDLLAVGNVGAIGTLTNHGAIRGDAGGGAALSNAGTVNALANSGTIQALNGAAILNQAGNIGTITNSGTISGSFGGVRNVGGTIGQLANASGGSINTVINASGVINAVVNSSGGTIGGIDNHAGATIGALANNGTIANADAAINNAGMIGTIANTASGTLHGDNIAISNSGQVAGVVNYGTISGNGFAIYSTGGGFGSIANSGVISGGVSVGGQNLTITGGNAAVFGTFTNGTMTVSGGDLTFAGGNTRLDQNIVVNGGSGTVTNAGSLFITNDISLSGSYAQTVDGVLRIGISGTGAGQYGHLTVTNAASFAGGLALQVLGGFALNVGAEFNLVDFASGYWDFSALSLNGAACTGSGNSWVCTNQGGKATLQLRSSNGGATLQLADVGQIPEPGSVTLLAAGLMGLGLLRRRLAGRFSAVS